MASQLSIFIITFVLIVTNYVSVKCDCEMDCTDSQVQLHYRVIANGLSSETTSRVINAGIAKQMRLKNCIFNFWSYSCIDRNWREICHPRLQRLRKGVQGTSARKRCNLMCVKGRVISVRPSIVNRISCPGLSVSIKKMLSWTAVRFFFAL